MKRFLAVFVTLTMLPLMVAEALAQGYQIQPGDVLRVEVL